MTTDTTHATPQIDDCDVSPVPFVPPPTDADPSHRKLLVQLEKAKRLVGRLPKKLPLSPYFAIWLEYEDFASFFRGQSVDLDESGCILSASLDGVDFKAWQPKEPQRATKVVL